LPLKIELVLPLGTNWINQNKFASAFYNRALNIRGSNDLCVLFVVGVVIWLGVDYCELNGLLKGRIHAGVIFNFKFAWNAFLSNLDLLFWAFSAFSSNSD
jgi:hypothetical protein